MQSVMNRKDKPMKTATLNNGITMPMLGFGVYQIAPE